MGCMAHNELCEKQTLPSVSLAQLRLSFDWFKQFKAAHNDLIKGMWPQDSIL